MLRAAAEGLQGANLTVLDGAEGLNSVVASLAAQGMSVLDALRNGLRTVDANSSGETSPVPNGARQLSAQRESANP